MALISGGTLLPLTAMNHEVCSKNERLTLSSPSVLVTSRWLLHNVSVLAAIVTPDTQQASFVSVFVGSELFGAYM